MRFGWVVVVLGFGVVACEGGAVTPTPEPVVVVTATTAVPDPTATVEVPADPVATAEPVATTPAEAPAATTAPVAATAAAGAGLADWLATLDATPEATGFAARPPDAYRGPVAVGDRTALQPAADEARSVQELLALIDAVGPPPDGQPLADAWADSLVALGEGLDALATCPDQAACEAALAAYEAAYTAWEEASAALPVAVG